ncbi:MAG: hypothetical protein ACM3RP_07230, partial [Chitinophagales bacterium]
VSFCDLPRRRWGDHLNWYIESGSPCIGCTEPGFPDAMEPFFAHLPDVGTPAVHATAQTAGIVVGGLTGAAIAGHLGLSLAKGRLQKSVATNVYREHHPEVAGKGEAPKPKPPPPPVEVSEELTPPAPRSVTPEARGSTAEERRQQIEAALRRAYSRRRSGK